MSKIASVAVVAFALILVAGSSGVRADNTRGLCNSAIAGGLGPAQQFVNGVGDPVQQCFEVGMALFTFLQTPGCFEAFVAGELRGLGGPANEYSAGDLKPVGQAICGALCGCGFFPDLPPEICPEPGFVCH
jgi:hypothetical protein